MLSVFHNRRWDWDYLTVKAVLSEQRIGRPTVIESSVCRHAPPRGWRGTLRCRRLDPSRLGRAPGRPGARARAGTVPQARLLARAGPWEGVDTGGHGRIALEFDDTLFQIETSRVCRIDRPRWWIVGTEGGFVKFGIDPQEDALRAGDIDRASELPEHRGIMRRPAATARSPRATSRPSEVTGTASTEISPTPCRGEHSSPSPPNPAGKSCACLRPQCSPRASTA